MTRVVAGQRPAVGDHERLCPWEVPGVDGTVSIYDIALAPLELAGLSRLL
jgi:hypothetical protein